MARDTSRDGFVNKLRSYVLTHFAWFWRLAERWPWLGRVVNRTLINTAVTRAESRPYALSTMAAYSSWASLTDRTWNGRHLPPRTWTHLPDPDAVAELFRRPAGKPRVSQRSTTLFPSFAQWFTDGFLRTDSDNPLKNTSTHEIDLNQLYGLNAQQTRALRSGAGGRLKTQTIGGEEYAPYLHEVRDGAVAVKPEFACLWLPLRMAHCPPTLLPTVFAFGGDRANSTPQTAMINTLFLREHNRVAGLLHTAHPTWDDDRLFETARNVLIVLLIKVVVEDYINHISPYLFRLKADPAAAWHARWNRQNWMATEFNLLYRWHSLVADDVDWPGGRVPTWGTLFNHPMLTRVGLGAAFDACSRQAATEISLFNTPDFLHHTEASSIRIGRLAQLASYNDYRAMVGYPRVTAFDQITGDEAVQKRLQAVYPTVDDIEFYVGLFAEEPRPTAGTPALIGRMVAIDAFSQALTNPLLAEHVFTAATFAPEGMAVIEGTRNLQDVVDRNVPAGPGKYLVTMTRPTGGG